MTSIARLHPFKALIVDDEPLVARRLARALEQEVGIVVAGLCHDGASALEAIAADSPDVVFLDIRMPGLDGMSVARALSGPDAPLVVFVTAFSKFATDAFRVEAIDYLLKPVETDRLRTSIARIRDRLAARGARREIATLRKALARVEPAKASAPAEVEIWAPTAHGAVRLLTEQIDWIGTEDDYVRLYAGAKTYLLRATLQGLLDRLAAHDFERVHRSAAVNVAHIRAMRRLAYGAWSVELASGQEVRVSRSRARFLRARLHGGL